VEWYPLLVDYESTRKGSGSAREHERKWARYDELKKGLTEVREALLQYAQFGRAQVPSLMLMSPSKSCQKFIVLAVLYILGDLDGWNNLLYSLADHRANRLDSRKGLDRPWIWADRKYPRGYSSSCFGGFLFGWLFGTAGIGGFISAILGAIVLLVIVGFLKR
jgi:hypothetical protein